MFADDVGMELAEPSKLSGCTWIDDCVVAGGATNTKPMIARLKFHVDREQLTTK